MLEEQSQLGNDMSLPSVVFGESCGVAAVVVITGGSYGLSVSNFKGSNLLLDLSRTDPVL